LEKFVPPLKATLEEFIVIILVREIPEVYKTYLAELEWPSPPMLLVIDPPPWVLVS
jgi:hypothetical protein